MTIQGNYKDKKARKEYQRKYQREYMREFRKTHSLTEEQKRNSYIRHKKYVTNKRREVIKLFGGCCSICGYNKCFWALDFHHKDRSTKEMAVSRNNSLDKMKKEAEKCILVCSNCHKEIHEREYA